MDIDKFVHEYFNKYSQNHTLNEVQVGCDWLRTTLTAVAEEAEARGVAKESARRDGIEKAIEQSIIDQHVTLAKEEARREALGVVDAIDFFGWNDRTQELIKARIRSELTK
jgi:hypothetical protein